MTSPRNVVLVVDNDEDMRDLLLTVLGHAGFGVLGASSARQALSLLDDVAPNAIIIDLLLTDMDGVELAETIRWRARQARTPIVMLTGAPEAAEQRLAKAGMDLEIIAKGIALESLTRKIADLCAPRTPVQA